MPRQCRKLDFSPILFTLKARRHYKGGGGYKFLQNILYKNEKNSGVQSVVRIDMHVQFVKSMQENKKYSRKKKLNAENIRTIYPYIRKKSITEKNVYKEHSRNKDHTQFTYKCGQGRLKIDVFTKKQYSDSDIYVLIR